MKVSNESMAALLPWLKQAASALGPAPKAAQAPLREAASPLASRALRNPTAPSTQAAASAIERPEIPGKGGERKRGAGVRAMKYAIGLAGGALLYKSSDDFFLSTTALRDGKGGFTSNARLDHAYAQAKAYYRDYQLAPAQARGTGRDALPWIQRCGNNQFATMTDYRAATKVHIEALADHPRARQSLMRNFDCLKGHLMKEESVARYQPSKVPKDFDLTKSPVYGEKGKYALVGVPNEETGARGYVSRSITQPFVNKGYAHFKAMSEAKGQSLRQCLETLETLLQPDSDGGLGPEAQLAAGQALLNFREVYADDAQWGHPEKDIMSLLVKQGLLLPSETEKIDASLMFEDPAKSIFKRNTGVAGPMLHRLETAVHGLRFRNDPQALADRRPMAQSKNIENLAIAHFKLNEQGNGFEDSSGLGDSFTCVNAIACINHARLMSDEPRLSKDELIPLIACFNAVYDDAGGVRHTLQEIARGCFAGAGYTVEEADAFYETVCRDAAQAFYGGRQLARAAEH